MIRVLLSDDHNLFREGIARILQDAPGIEFVGCAQNGAEAVSKAKEHRPDVILMDVHMPVMDGVKATQEIRSMLPETKILMLTVSENDEDLFGALRAGARGYLLKNTTSQNLIEGVRRIAAGDSIINPGMAAKLVDQFAAISPETSTPNKYPENITEEITPRERDVLQLVARGLSNKEIGQELNISPHTVKSHLSNTMEKLGLSGRVEAAAWAIRHGLLNGS